MYISLPQNIGKFNVFIDLMLLYVLFVIILNILENFVVYIISYILRMVRG